MSQPGATRGKGSIGGNNDNKRKQRESRVYKVKQGLTKVKKEKPESTVVTMG